jgi:4-hydroxy-tetrahydrodipicolinate reductase
MKIIIHGITGKMGQTLYHTALETPDIEVVAGVDKRSPTEDIGVSVYPNLSAVPRPADVVVDFSVREALSGLLSAATAKKLPLVIATTGLTDQDQRMILQASEKIPVLQSANYSLGINLMYALARKMAGALGENWDIEIIEQHHNQKKDAPSGTAYALADAINAAFNGEKEYVFGRYSQDGLRKSNEIGIHAIRGGTIAGVHSVLFAGNDEVLTLTHTAHSKTLFASGALTAARFLAGKTPGLYHMQDILGL